MQEPPASGMLLAASVFSARHCSGRLCSALLTRTALSPGRAANYGRSGQVRPGEATLGPASTAQSLCWAGGGGGGGNWSATNRLLGRPSWPGHTSANLQLASAFCVRVPADWRLAGSRVRECVCLASGCAVRRKLCTAALKFCTLRTVNGECARKPWADGGGGGGGRVARQRRRSVGSSEEATKPVRGLHSLRAGQSWRARQRAGASVQQAALCSARLGLAQTVQCGRQPKQTCRLAG